MFEAFIDLKHSLEIVLIFMHHLHDIPHLLSDSQEHDTTTNLLLQTVEGASHHRIIFRKSGHINGICSSRWRLKEVSQLVLEHR